MSTFTFPSGHQCKSFLLHICTANTPISHFHWVIDMKNISNICVVSTYCYLVGALFRFSVKPSFIIKFPVRAPFSFLLFSVNPYQLESRLRWASHVPIGRSFQQNLQTWPFQRFIDKTTEKGHFSIFCHISKSTNISCESPETLVFFSHFFFAFLGDF